MCRRLPEPPPKIDRDQELLEEAVSFDQALIPPGDPERLKAVLSQSEIEYKEANAEHPNPMQTAAARTTK